ncbi:hypothetical protein PAECIP111893_02355 [Paenibacillus plantiphilus]|uniref:Lipoprotein n=1 Tax=Paenibacillus plantiphilus TaxID=2905650 RepID=A0ABM9C6P6_9BACL|nr:hypothetical protein [Paenibacillus plantiphilus]CAH1205473.1 hypothetical protein PAECIP111893_02355 [Paenibacillus plantiphilus]
MNKYKVKVLLALSLVLTACSNVNEPAAAPSVKPTVEVQSSSTQQTTNIPVSDSDAGKLLEQLIPDQWRTIPDQELFKATGDLNGDGIEDIAIALEEIKHEPEEAPRRALLLALGAGDGRYLKSAINEAIVYRADEGGVSGDPFASLRIEDATVHLEHYGGSNWRWSNGYRIGWRDGGWYAIGYSSSSEYLNSPSYEEIKYEANTGEVESYKLNEDGKEDRKKRQIDPGKYIKFEDLTPESFDFIIADPLTYKSESLGFSITFPESWSGYYRVAEEEERTMNIFFMGESEISRASLFDEEPGLYMFSIGTYKDLEEYGDLLDNVKEIGELNGTTYYFFTATDCSTCLLTYTDDLKEGDEERTFRDSDYQRVGRMNEDIEQIVQTFKGL